MPVNPKIEARPVQLLVAVLARVNRALGQLLLWLVRLYQLTLSPFIGNQCRFHPTCSHYAMEAIQQHGPWRGSWLAATRLGRCHPFAAGGVDPVPSLNPNEVPSSGSPTVQPQLQPHVKDAL